MSCFCFLFITKTNLLVGGKVFCSLLSIMPGTPECLVKNMWTICKTQFLYCTISYFSCNPENRIYCPSPPLWGSQTEGVKDLLKITGVKPKLMLALLTLLKGCSFLHIKFLPEANSSWSRRIWDPLLPTSMELRAGDYMTSALLCLRGNGTQWEIWLGKQERKQLDQCHHP